MTEFGSSTDTSKLGELFDELSGTLPRLMASYRSQIGFTARSKVDGTLVTEADYEIEEYLRGKIREAYPDAGIVGEESSDQLSLTALAARQVWVIDPIDGTREFVNPGSTEFCSVLGLIEDQEPVAAFVLAPELGVDRSPVSVECRGTAWVRVNGQPGDSPPVASGHVSITRSAGTRPREIELALARQGKAVKIRTTSQTLDMVRTCVDLSSKTSDSLPSFEFFYRERQKLWDGIAGLALARAQGMKSVTIEGEAVTPITPEKACEDWTLPSVLVGSAAAINEALALLQPYAKSKEDRA